MSSLIALPEFVQGAAQDLAGIGSSLADATVTASGPTTGIVAAAEDEVSLALARLFGSFGQQFQAISTQAQAFHTQFANLMNSTATAYVGAEAANAEAVLLDGAGIAAPYEKFAFTTLDNASALFGASRASLNTFVGGVSRGFGLLATNPAGFLTNLQTAAQSVVLVGAPNDVVSSVLQHTLGGVTSATNPFAEFPNPTVVPVNDAHGEVYAGLVGDGYIPTGPDGLLLATILNLASSPLSGLAIGAVGPFVSPAVSLWNSAGSVFADVTGGNLTGAFGHLLSAPVNAVDAFFNGATLNGDALAPVFNPFVSGGSGGAEELTGLSLGFGGLLSPGQVVTGADGPMYYGVGGSLFNSLGLDLSFLPPDDFAGGNIEIPAVGIGPIAATANFFSILGHALGGTL